MDKKFILGVLILCGSIGFNLIQYYTNQKLEIIRSLDQSKNTILSNGYDEMVYNTLNKMDQNIQFNQGKIEGMVAVINNLKPKDNEYTDIWHNGYNRGLDQGLDQEMVAYQNGYNQAAKDYNQTISENVISQRVAEAFKNRNKIATPPEPKKVK